MKITQRFISLKRDKGATRRKRPELLTKAEQLIRILRATTLADRIGREFRCTENVTHLLSVRKASESQADSYFLSLLLNSRYSTYWKFLETLWSMKQIRIPGSKSARDASFRAELNRIGIPANVWSFFVLRDLFYEFSLLNFFNQGDVQQIVPLYAIGPTKDKSYDLSFVVEGQTVSFWPHIEVDDFLRFLSQLYLEQTAGRWNEVVELLVLREAFSVKHRIPEREFNDLFMKSLHNESKFRIVPSVGFIQAEPGANYLIKAASLPAGSARRPYSIFRMEPATN